MEMKEKEKSVIKTESFEWTTDFDKSKAPQGNLIKFVAKTTIPTVHMEDLKEGLKSPIRIFPPKELTEAARSLILRPIGINHMKPIYGAYTLDAQWNEKEQQVEGIGYVPDNYIAKIRSGDIKTCSVEFHWRKEVEVPGGTEYHGLWFQGVDLLENMSPGDVGTSVSLFESASQQGIFNGVVSPPEIKGEPFGPYKDWDACIVDQQSKGKDAETAKKICGSMQGNLEAVAPVVPAVKPDEKDEKIKGLESSIVTLRESIKSIEASQNKLIAGATRVERERIVKQIKEALPAPQYERYFNAGAQRFVEKVKQIAHKESL